MTTFYFNKSIMPSPRKDTALSEAPTAVKVKVTKPKNHVAFANKTTRWYTGGVKTKAPKDPFRVSHKRSSAGFDGGVTRKRTKSKKN